MDIFFAGLNILISKLLTFLFASLKILILKMLTETSSEFPSVVGGMFSSAEFPLAAGKVHNN
jgi:hypothetical protein